MRNYLTLKAVALIVLIGVLAWYPVLNFWFLKAFEASWLHDALPYTFVGLIRTHSFLYWLDLKLFGWNPTGWYALAVLFHIIAALLLYRFVLVLTKNRLTALAAALIFVANTAYNDVLTWGSFNSYYPVLLSLILLGFTAFFQYKETGKAHYWLLSIIFLMLGFYVRETGILAVFLITLFDIFTAGNLWRKKTWLAIVGRQWPYYASLGLFLYLRSHYGGTIGDTVDSNVKMRIRLVHDQLYAEYLRVAALTFGKIILPIFAPYLWFNAWRTQLLVHGNVAWLQQFFFPMLGWIGYGVIFLVALLTYKQKAFFRYLLFFWLWVGAFTAFIALAIPNVNEVLMRDFQIITLRYCYFAFAGASISYAILLTLVHDRLAKLKWPFVAGAVTTLLLAAIVGLNLRLLRGIETEAYATLYRAGKEFQAQFKKEFPILPTNVAFYIYPHANALNDSLFEWYLTRETAYPNLKGQPYRIESQVEAVVDKASRGKLNVADVIFLDYDAGRGLTNKTPLVRQAIENQKATPLTLVKGSGANYSVPTFTGPSIDLPVNFALTVASNYTSALTPGANANSSQFRALVDYAVDRQRYLNTVKLISSRTISQRDEEPFYFYQPSHLVDGNTGRRSAWIADAVPAWAGAVLPEPQSIQAVAWGSIVGSTRVPASYHYQTSDDGVTWQTVKTVTNGQAGYAIDRFDKPLQTRYIKMVIDTTNSGDFAELDEFEVITTKSAAALAQYTDRNKLLDDSRNPFQFAASADDLQYAKDHGLDFATGKLSWGTNLTSPYIDSQFIYFTYPLGSTPQTVQIHIPEGEIYAEAGQLFMKFFNSFSVDLATGPLTSSAVAAQLLPRYGTY